MESNANTFYSLHMYLQPPLNTSIGMEAITWTGKNAFHSYIIALLIVFAYIIILDRLIALTPFNVTFLDNFNAK